MQWQRGQKPVPGYELEEKLGEGAFGQVWKARSRGGLWVAIKFLNVRHRRGLKEFQSLKRVVSLQHPQLVSLHSVWILDQNGHALEDDALDQSDGSVCDTFDYVHNEHPVPSTLVVVMELGTETLEQRLRKCQLEDIQGLPVAELLKHIGQAARAIDFLNQRRHDLGGGPVRIIHGDVKPSNILLVSGDAKLADFSLTRPLDEAHAPGGLQGSIAYAAPECLDGNGSHSSDQYSLAVTYYQLRTGTLPFSEECRRTPEMILLAHAEGKLDFSLVTPAEASVLARATAKEPNHRFPSATEMVAHLRHAVEQHTPLRGTETRVDVSPRINPYSDTIAFDPSVEARTRRTASWLRTGGILLGSLLLGSLVILAVVLTWPDPQPPAQRIPIYFDYPDTGLRPATPGTVQLVNVPLEEVDGRLFIVGSQVPTRFQFRPAHLRLDPGWELDPVRYRLEKSAEDPGTETIAAELEDQKLVFHLRLTPQEALSRAFASLANPASDLRPYATHLQHFSDESDARTLNRRATAMAAGRNRLLMAEATGDAEQVSRSRIHVFELSSAGNPPKVDPNRAILEVPGWVDELLIAEDDHHYALVVRRTSQQVSTHSNLDQRSELWIGDLATGKLRSLGELHDTVAIARKVAFSADGAKLYVGQTDYGRQSYEIDVWNTETDSRRDTPLYSAEGQLRGLAVSHHPPQLFAVDSASIHTWPLPLEIAKDPVTLHHGQAFLYYDVAASTGRLAYAARDKSIQVRDPNEWVSAAEGVSDLSLLALDAEGHCMVSASAGHASRWKLQNGQAPQRSDLDHQTLLGDRPGRDSFSVLEVVFGGGKWLVTRSESYPTDSDRVSHLGIWPQAEGEFPPCLITPIQTVTKVAVVGDWLFGLLNPLGAPLIQREQDLQAWYLPAVVVSDQLPR